MCSALHGVTGEFYQTFKEELIVMLLKLSHNKEKTGTSLCLHKTSIYFKLKAAKEENYRPISLMNLDIKILKRLNSRTYLSHYSDEYYDDNTQ